MGSSFLFPCWSKRPPLGGWAFPVSHHPRSPHPGRKPWGNKFCLHTHSDKCAFTSKGWKINPYRIQEHSSRELYTKRRGWAHIARATYTTRPSIWLCIHTAVNRHTLIKQFLFESIFTKIKTGSESIVGNVQFRSFISKKKKNPSSRPLLFSSSFSLSRSADQYQSYNDDEQPASRKESQDIFLFCSTCW